LTSKTDPRRLLVFGLVLGSLTMFSLSGLNLNAGYWDIFWPQVFQGVALSFLFIPLMALSMAGIPKEKMGNATSIFNLMRNIGGSVGIAVMTTFLARRTQMHQNVLVGKITAGNLKTGSMLQGMQGWFHRNGVDSYVASRRAWASLYGMVQRNASMLSFVEAFWVMGVLFLVMMPFVLLLRNPRRKPPLPGPPPPAEQITEVHEESQDEELLLVHG
jgi:DHA2 family multidrug resistance protein